MSGFRSASAEDVAFAVCTAMELAGATAVLVGGGAATIYAPLAYTTRDLDFVLSFAWKQATEVPLLRLGFKHTHSRGIYEHDETPLTVEFLDGPVAVGGHVVGAWATLRRNDELLHILRPEDCIKDRLAAGIHWRDANATRQAAEVAKLHPIDLAEVEAWCLAEGGQFTFKVFKEFLSA